VEKSDGLEQLTLWKLREKGQALGVEPVGTYRDTRRPELWVEALRAAATAAQHAAAAAATAAARAARAAAAEEAYFDRPRQRTLNTASYDGWQRGVRVDGRDAAQVAVQQRVVDLDASSEEGEARGDTGDESFVLGAEGSDDEDEATAVTGGGS
jgi:hypothetical protein